MLLPLMGDLNGNDPAALLDGGTLWFVTGGASIVAKTSTDLVNVEDVGQVLGELPAWVATEVPDAQGMWSPELVHFGGLYHLYYAVSSIGSSRSCIGHATAEELSAASTWADRGPVVCSKSGDDFNAIDPTVLVSSDDEIWLAYGSFLSGIKIGQLDAMGTTFVSDPATIASRADAGGALQAAALTEDDGFFYLFVSFGVGTSHQLMMGRARSIQGPYVDQEGVPMLEGGGSPLLESGARYHGPGSNDVFAMGEQRYHVYHAYDRDNADRATLRVSTLERGDGGWPRSDGP